MEKVNKIHDIYDDEWWEFRNPQVVRAEEYADLMGITPESCRAACEKAKTSSEPIKETDANYWLLGEEDEEDGSFYGAVYVFPRNSYARFIIEDTSVALAGTL